MLKFNQAFLLQILIFFAFIGMTLPYPTITPMLLLTHTSETHMFFSISISNKTFVSILLGIYPLGLFFGGLVLGWLSDKYSKKSLLLVSVFFSIVIQIISGCIVINEAYFWLLASRFLSGTFEGNIAIARASLAVLCNTEKLKVKHFGRINAALTLGWVVGPLLGGMISHFIPIGSLCYSMPYFVSAFFGLIVFLIVIFYFDESQYICAKTEKENKKIIKNSRIHKNTKNIVYFMFGTLWVTLGIDAFYQFLPIYLSGYFKYGSLFVGIFIALVAIFNSMSNIVLMPLLNSRFKIKNILLIFLNILTVLLICFSFNKLQTINYILLPMIGISIGIIMTSMTVLISSRVSLSSQGKLMGFLLSQRTLGTAFVSVSVAPFLHISYTFPFLIGALLILISTLLLIFIFHREINVC